MNPTGIEWVKNPDGSKGHVWNPLRARDKETGKRGKHCEPVHDGCKFCWASALNAMDGERGGTGLDYKPGNRDKVDLYLDEKTLIAPLKKKKPTRVFVCSMTDPFGAWVKPEWLDTMFAVMALCQQHTFIILTKRPAAMRAYLAQAILQIHACALVMSGGDYSGFSWPLPNVWLLASCSEQKDAAEFVPILLDTPAAKRGVSLEPLLGPIDLKHLDINGDGEMDALSPGSPAEHWRDAWCPEVTGLSLSECIEGFEDWGFSYPPSEIPMRGLDWVIVGGESGRKDQAVRPMHPQWVQSLHDQCRAANVPFFFKQWGEWLPWMQFVASGVEDGDPAECTRFPTMEWENGRWCDAGHPSWVDSADGAIDDSECVGRVGKRRAGHRLDGAEHRAWPEAAP